MLAKMPSKLLFISVIVVLGACTPAPKAEKPPRPHIVLILCDDLGWGDTGFNGHPFIQTPQLDALARQGIQLNRFYSASPVCSPTRASCLTGRNPYRMGIPTANSGHMREGEHTLAELLQAEGYATGHFGKWHLGTLTTQIKDANRGRPGDSTHYRLPSMNGFDVYFSTESKVPTYDPMIKPQAFDTARGENLRFGWAATTPQQATQPYGTYYWEGEAQRVTEGLEGDNTALIMDRARAFMRQAVAREQPFFSAIWIHTPHLPVVADARHRQLYAAHSHREQLYYGTITAMDEQIGALKQTLDSLGIFEDTWIWFASDNGPERQTPGTAGPYRERKRSLHEGGIRVPAFTVWPRTFGSEQQSAFPAYTSDYLPTILDYLAIPYPDERPLDGISLADALEGEQAVRAEPMGFRFRNQVAWMDQQYKLISKDQGETFELYDLLQDPEEATDLAALQPERVTNMRRALEAWVASCERSEAGADYP